VSASVTRNEKHSLFGAKFLSLSLIAEGDHIKIAASKYPFPTICRDKQSTDWFNSISRTLRWNEREKQKSFVVVEEDRAKPVKEKSKKRVPKDGAITNDMSGNPNISGETTGGGGEGEAEVESGQADQARIEASKKEAQMGQDRLAAGQDKVSVQMEQMRGQADKGKDEDEDDEDESGDEEDDDEEEEEGFDIDE
jgi:NAD+ kinase